MTQKIKAKDGYKLKLISANDGAIEYEEVSERKVWVPVEGDNVFFLFDDGGISEVYYKKWAYKHFLQGLVFRTYKQARLERDSRAKLQEIRMAIQEEWVKHDWEPCFDGAQHSYCFSCMGSTSNVIIQASRSYPSRPIFDHFPRESKGYLQERFTPAEWALAYLKEEI